MLISFGVALLAVAIVYISILFLDPGMNVEKAFGIIFYAFFGSGILTALVLMFGAVTADIGNCPSSTSNQPRGGAR